MARRGLDNAGKTTIVKKFNGEDIDTIEPTLGFNIKTMNYRGSALRPPLLLCINNDTYKQHKKHELPRVCSAPTSAPVHVCCPREHAWTSASHHAALFSSGTAVVVASLPEPADTRQPGLPQVQTQHLGRWRPEDAAQVPHTKP